MTSKDFVRYYAEHRKKARPDADIRSMAVVRDGSGNVPTPKPKKPLLPAADARDRAFVSGIVSKLPMAVRGKYPALEERAAEVHKWLSADTIREVPASEKRRFPVSIASAILVMVISLSLLVGGSVMYSDAYAEYRTASDALDAVLAEEKNLENDLSVKVDLVEAENYAKNTLGMVEKEYVIGEYASLQKEETVEVYEEEKSSFGLSTLLSVFGFGG